MKEKRDEQKQELEYHFDRLDEEGRKLLLLFARKIPSKEKRADIRPIRNIYPLIALWPLLHRQ